jgi:hypothetical protein
LPWARVSALPDAMIRMAPVRNTAPTTFFMTSALQQHCCQGAGDIPKYAEDSGPRLSQARRFVLDTAGGAPSPYYCCFLLACSQARWQHYPSAKISRCCDFGSPPGGCPPRGQTAFKPSKSQAFRRSLTPLRTASMWVHERSGKGARSVFGFDDWRGSKRFRAPFPFGTCPLLPRCGFLP